MQRSRIPIIECSSPLELGKIQLEAARVLRDKITLGQPDWLLRFAEWRARLWLERNSNPYVGEIAELDTLLGRPGLFILNTCYDWLCTTSAHPDPSGAGSRMIRTLDWRFPYLGHAVTVAHHPSVHGAWFNVTWPGSVGVLTAMCPGRFSIAINQAPQQQLFGALALDFLWGANRVWRLGGLPIMHLVRQICEQAPDFEAAVRMVEQAPQIAQAGFITISGIEAAENVIIERLRDTAVVIHAPEGDAVANDWLSPLSGQPTAVPTRARPRGQGSGQAELAANCAARRSQLRALMGQPLSAQEDFNWLTEPMRNEQTRLAVVANAKLGTISVAGFEHERGVTVQVTDVREIRAPVASAA